MSEQVLCPWCGCLVYVRIEHNDEFFDSGNMANVTKDCPKCLNPIALEVQAEWSFHINFVKKGE